jgi:small-conductance mechanosensitive channel
MTIKFLKSVVLCLFLLQPVLGWSQETESVSEVAEPTWTASEIMALPVDWWPKFITEDTEEFRIRADLLIGKINEYVGGLDAENLVLAQTGVNSLRANLDAVLTVQSLPTTLQIATLPTLDNYSMQQFLDLRKLWRETGSQLKALELEHEQFGRQRNLLEQRRDLTLAQYSDTDPSSPARLLAGLRRINLHVELYAHGKLLGINNAQQAQINSYLDDVNQQIKYAADHLFVEELSLAHLDSTIQGLNIEVTKAAAKLTVAQQKLLDAINAETPDTYKILNLKQQLTGLTAEELLARLKVELQYAKRDWFLLRSGSTTSTDNLYKGDPVLRALLTEATQLSTLWSRTSQNTLVTPAPDKDRKAKKAYAEAQASAHETLGLIAEVNATIDNLSLIRDQVTSESLELTRGLGGGWLRIKVYSQRLWTKSKNLLNTSLFHIGDRPVTAGGITKALFIFLFFYVVSWLIRHFLDRLERRQHFEQGSFYAGGRVLHYIILTIAGIAALGSIGLDFSNFALIAGALSVGIGFGLQSVVLNFVSGLILLFESSIRVGDYIELDSGNSDSSLMGVVKEIRSRSTLVNTNDNVDVIVPNSELVGNRMINWTLRESTARMRIPFSVAYGSDKELVTKAALEAAAEGEFCIQHTPGLKAAVRMISFGDSALKFELRVWVNRQGVRRPIFVRSSILWEMDTKFREYGIKVPFPQRDMHFPDGSGLMRPNEPVPEPTDQ